MILCAFPCLLYQLTANTNFLFKLSSRTQSSSRTPSAIVADALLPSIPGFILRGMLNYLPTAAFRALRLNRKLSTQVSEELMTGKTEALNLGLEAEKDLLTVLVRANIKNKGTGKLSGDELSQQIPSVVIAGQGATVRTLPLYISFGSFSSQGNTIAWALYELAKNPEYQQLLRDEIVHLSPSNGTEFSYNDLESMPQFNAFLKVSIGTPIYCRLLFAHYVDNNYRKSCVFMLAFRSLSASLIGTLSSLSPSQSSRRPVNALIKSLLKRDSSSLLLLPRTIGMSYSFLLFEG
jgi:Cytochrome P450